MTPGIASISVAIPTSTDPQRVSGEGSPVIAGVLEVIWASTMKQSQGFTKLAPTAVTLVTMLASFGLLAVSMKTLPLSTAYVVWTGIGAIGAFLVGIAFLAEPITPARIAAALLIVSGLAVMKLS